MLYIANVLTELIATIERQYKLQLYLHDTHLFLRDEFDH
jgi:hypothetical protein